MRRWPAPACRRGSGWPGISPRSRICFWLLGCALSRRLGGRGLRLRLLRQFAEKRIEIGNVVALLHHDALAQKLAADRPAVAVVLLDQHLRLPGIEIVVLCVCVGVCCGLSAALL